MARIRLLALVACILCGGALVAAFRHPTAPQPEPPAQPAPKSQPAGPITAPIPPTPRTAPAPSLEPEPEFAPPPEVEAYPPLVRFGDSRLRHTAPVNSLALTADGSRLLTATLDEPLLRLWDTKSGRLLRAVHVEAADTDSITVLAMTSDARTAFILRRLSWEGEGQLTEPAAIDLLTGAVVRWPLERATVDRHPIFALSPDEKTLAGIIRGEVRVWEFTSGVQRVLGTIPNWNEFEGGICFSPDGMQIAACRSRSEFFLAPVNGNAPLLRVPVKCDNEVVLAVFWQQPNRVVVLCRKELIAFDPTTGAEIERGGKFEGNIVNPPRGVAGGGKLFAQEYYNPITAYDLAALTRVQEGMCACEIHDPLAVSADGRVLAVGRSHAVLLYDARTGTPLHPELVRAPCEPLVHLHISLDGARVLGGTEDSAIALELSDGRVLAGFEETLWRSGFAISPDGRFAAVRRSKRGSMVVELQTGREFPLPKPEMDEGTNRPIGFAGPNRVWRWSDGANTFTSVEIGTNRTVATLAGFEGSQVAAVSPDGRKLAASGRTGLVIRALDADQGWEVLDNYEERKKSPRCEVASTYGTPVRFSPCGGWLLVSDFGLELWDIRKKPVRVGHFGSAGYHELSDGNFSPDGRFLATPVRAKYGETELCVLETASLAEVYRFHPTRGVASGAFTPDGRLIIAHCDTTLGVWDRGGLEARLCGPVPVGEEWRWLGSRDAKHAHAAVRALAANPDRALAVLAPAFAPADTGATTRLITELGAEEFRVRENAERRLAELGLRAELALRTAGTTSESPEVRARAAALLGALGPHEGRLAGEWLRAVRVVEVLERIASPEAKALLATWAKTDPNGLLAIEVNAALARPAKK